MFRDDTYKMYQLLGMLVEKYDYHQILIKQYSAFNNNERWLANPDREYQLIRISFSSASTYEYEKDRINTYINYMKSFYHADINFLDIHINQDLYDENLEPHDYINIDLNYAEGKDVHNSIPEIYSALKEVENNEKEIMRINNLLVSITQNRINKRKKYIPYVTYTIMTICIIMQILCLLLERKYSSGASLIVLGGDYLTFTLGLKQLYRLITCAFLHGGIGHLFANMYSLFFLGNYVERRYGRIKFLFILFTSVLVGSLSQDIISGNTVTIGISGGLYGLMLVYIMDMVTERRISINSFIPLILVNLMINFISTTAWLAHLGGLLAAYIIYKIIKENNKGMIALLVIMIVVLFVRLLTIKTISPLYGRTDMEIIRIYEDLGLNNYSQRILEKLSEVYLKYGG